MNKTILTTLATTFALGGLAAIAQDARPALEKPAPTPMEAVAAPDESTVADESTKAGEDLLVSDSLLRKPGTALTPFEKLDEKRPFAAQPPSPENGISLDQAIETAIGRNADILKQIAEIKRTRGQVVEVRAQALPQLGVSSNYSESRTFGRNSSGSSSGATFQTVDADGNVVTTKSFNSSSSSSPSNRSWNVSFEVRQLIYSGGQVGAAIRGARIGEDSSFYELRNVVDQVIASVRQQFYTVLLNRALINVQEESITLLESQLRDQRNRFDAGTVPRFNVLTAEVALSNAQPDLIRARNNYRTAQLTLAKLVGVSWPTTTDLTPFPIKGQLVYNPIAVNLQQGIDLALERRAFLKVQRQSILAQVEQVRFALSGYQPTITSNAGYQYRNDSSSSSLSDSVDGWFFGVSGSWAIFDGLKTAGRVQQARASLESARVIYDDSVRQVELEVQTTYSSLIQGRELIESQQKTVEQAQEALRLAEERLSAGAGTQLDVLNARVSLTQSQTTALQALSDYNSTLAEYDRVTGAVTVYHDTFRDPLADKAARKKWIAELGKKKPVWTDQEIRDFLLKRRTAPSQ